MSAELLELLNDVAEERAALANDIIEAAKKAMDSKDIAERTVLLLEIIYAASESKVLETTALNARDVLAKHLP